MKTFTLMYIVHSYPLAVILYIVTMMCWGSWANTQKLAAKNWEFPLFYWDYTNGLILMSLLIGLTFGSIGLEGQGFIQNLLNASLNALIGLMFISFIIGLGIIIIARIA